MWPETFPARLQLALLVSIALVGSATTWIGERLIRSHAQQTQQDLLRLACRRVADQLPFPWVRASSPEIKGRLDKMVAETLCDLNVTDAEGILLASSDAPSNEKTEQSDAAPPRSERSIVGASLAHEPDLVLAQSSGEGVDHQVGDRGAPATVRFALRVTDQEGRVAGFVRASLPDVAGVAAVRTLRLTIASVAASVAALASLFVHRVTQQIARPLARLADAADNMTRGLASDPVDFSASPEVVALAQALERFRNAASRREETLRENLDRRSAVLTGMLEGVIAVDRDESILFANPAAGKLLGFATQDISRRTLLEVARSHALRAAVRDVLRDGQPCRRELHWNGPPLRELEIHVMPLPGAPCPGVIAVIDDVTQLRRLETARQQFIANVSHELKTPLSAIKAYTETLLGGALHDPQNNEKFLGRIAEQADRLHQLILDMLSLARIEAGQASLDVRDVSIQRIVARAVANQEQRAAAAELSLTQTIEPTNLAVRADEEGLRQILDNLIDNALKFTPQGGTVSVHARPDGQEAVIAVVDSGVGISPEHLERLFERFYRVDKARSRELGGTGLGLSIVKHLTQTMGGSVRVTSQPGKGSIFTVRLPLASASNVTLTKP